MSISQAVEQNYGEKKIVNPLWIILCYLMTDSTIL